MVTGKREVAGNPVSLGDLTLRIDGSRPLAAESVAELAGLCGRAEDGDATRAGAPNLVILRVSGAPGPDWSDELPMNLVSKWERGLRRMERLPALIIVIAEGDCGGQALDALLAADYRVMTAGARLVFPVVAGAAWPGMALYRLARQAAGTSLARRAALLGTPVGAAEAHATGVVDDVAENATLALDKAVQVAGTVPGAEVAIRRQLMLEATTSTFEEALGAHLAACDRALRGVTAG